MDLNNGFFAWYGVCYFDGGSPWREDSGEVITDFTGSGIWSDAISRAQ